MKRVFEAAESEEVCYKELIFLVQRFENHDNNPICKKTQLGTINNSSSRPYEDAFLASHATDNLRLFEKGKKVKVVYSCC